MQATQNASFCCPRCNNFYDWRPEIVGRMAKCSCGHVLKVPKTPGRRSAAPGAAQASAGRGATPPPLPRRVEAAFAGSLMDAMPASTAPTAGRPMMSARADDTLDEATERELRETGGYGEDESGLNEWDETRDKNVPLALLVAGMLPMLGYAIFKTAHLGLPGIMGAMIGTAVGLFINTVIMLIAVLVAAKVAGINFGPGGPVIIKLCAAYTGPMALGSVVTMALGGDMAVFILGNAVSVVFYWALLSYLFKLDGQQTMIVVVTVTAVKILLALCIVQAIMGRAPSAGAFE
jgi:hypothetical protein